MVKTVLRALTVVLAAIILGFLGGSQSHAQLDFSGASVTSDVTVVRGPPDLFRYRYTITNPNPNAGVVRLTVDQDPVHAGENDETNVEVAGTGTFTKFPGNYVWDNFLVPGNGSVTVGFDDIHGPRSATLLLVINGRPIFDTVNAPVPALRRVGEEPRPGLGEIVQPLLAPYPSESTQGYRLEGSFTNSVEGVFQYKYFLRNIGNTAFGPNVDPTSDNHADFYVNESLLHLAIHDEVFNQPDNQVATGFGVDSLGHTPTIGPQEPLPQGIGVHHYYWEGLGDGPAGPWAPGQVITLGFRDEHASAVAAWNGRLHGSGETVPTEPFEAADQVPDVPAVPKVGGISVDPDVDALPLEAPDSSSSNRRVLAAGAAAVAAGALALGGGAWYARRRWLR